MLEPDELDVVLARVARGEREAYLHVVRRFQLPLRGYLASQLHHLDQVDDLAQEVFLGAFQNLAAFRLGDDFWAWLRGIARHKLQNHFRTVARRNAALGRFQAEVAGVVEADLDAAAAEDSADKVEALLRCIAKLPDKLRSVVRAGLDQVKPSVLAEQLKTSVGAVYQLNYRANQLLRECVGRELEPE